MASWPKHAKSTISHHRASNQHAAISSQPPPPLAPCTDDSSFKQNFSHPSLERKFNKDYAKQDVKLGRVIDFNYLESINFPYIDNFRDLG